MILADTSKVFIAATAFVQFLMAKATATATAAAAVVSEKFDKLNKLNVWTVDWQRHAAQGDRETK